MKKTFSLIATTAALTLAFAAHAETPLTIKVYSADDNSFNVNSTLIMGEKDAVLLDTGFTRADAYRIAANVLDSGKNLKTILISQADPDYYFGADVLRSIFPNAEIVTTAAVHHDIEEKVKKKIDFWGPKMGNNAPQSAFIPNVLTDNRIDLEGKTIEVRGTEGAFANRPFVWIPSIQTIAGDVNTYGNMHVWTADSATPALRQAWLKRLDEMKALKPKTFVPGHMTVGTTLTPNTIDYTRQYLVTFEKNLKNAKNSADLIKTMKAAYPKASAVGNLELGAKVATGEMKW